MNNDFFSILKTCVVYALIVVLHTSIKCVVYVDEFPVNNTLSRDFYFTIIL